MFDQYSANFQNGEEMLMHGDMVRSHEDLRTLVVQVDAGLANDAIAIFGGAVHKAFLRNHTDNVVVLNPGCLGCLQHGRKNRWSRK